MSGRLNTTPVEIRPLGLRDVRGLTACVLRCYGESYPKRALYDPEQLSALVANGHYDGVVAAAGEAIVGHIGYSWPTAEATAVEAGTTIVDPNHRGAGLMGRMATLLGERLAEQRVCGFIHFPTTAHTIMQRAATSANGLETGILIAYLPAATRDLASGTRGDGRLAVTVVYQPVGDAPSVPICVPARYQHRIPPLALQLGLDRPRVAPENPGRALGTRLEHARDEARDLEQVTITEIGRDVGTRVAQILAACDSGLVHVDVSLGSPTAEFAVEALSKLGFAYGAWLPGWAPSDVLRLQLVRGTVPPELAPDLYTAQARALMEEILAELG